jgi:hypothetical protein
MCLCMRACMRAHNGCGRSKVSARDFTDGCTCLHECFHTLANCCRSEVNLLRDNQRLLKLLEESEGRIKRMESKEENLLRDNQRLLKQLEESELKIKKRESMLVNTDTDKPRSYEHVSSNPPAQHLLRSRPFESSDYSTIQSMKAGENGPASQGRACLECGIVKQHCLVCGRCRNAVYCSRECQALNWSAGHSRECTLVQ